MEKYTTTVDSRGRKKVRLEKKKTTRQNLLGKEQRTLEEKKSTFLFLLLHILFLLSVVLCVVVQGKHRNSGYVFLPGQKSPNICIYFFATCQSGQLILTITLSHKSKIDAVSFFCKKLANFLLVFHRTYVAQHPPYLFFPFRLIPLLFFGHILFFFFPPSPLFHTILFAYFPFLFVLVSAPTQPNHFSSPQTQTDVKASPTKHFPPLSFYIASWGIFGCQGMKQLREKSQKFFICGKFKAREITPTFSKISRFRAGRFLTNYYLILTVDFSRDDFVNE